MLSKKFEKALGTRLEPFVFVELIVVFVEVRRLWKGPIFLGDPDWLSEM